MRMEVSRRRRNGLVLAVSLRLFSYQQGRQEPVITLIGGGTITGKILAVFPSLDKCCLLNGDGLTIINFFDISKVGMSNVGMA